MGRCAAFFDIDGTIVREGLISELFRKMVRFELIDENKWHKEVKPAFSRWTRRVGDYEQYLQKMVDIYLDSVRGLSPVMIEHVARQVIDQNFERVYTYTRDRLNFHRQQGHLVIAISGSPIELVRELSSRYEMDDYRGTVYEIGEDGTYSGTIHPMWDSASKRKAVLAMVKKYNLDLDLCYAYGDTNGDATMLSLVGHPFAINPTLELVRRIQADASLKAKIAIVIERKDVIYRLDTDCLRLV